ncbi:uncharacterized protein (TIGR02599 family) [Roseimicrobium gellanilyticum]|uniref:Uncharacterized protein (TIGR02599 family) n=1 Tax=Roseimicrobium gellanilyticum TaxID=748857 RepID=A0A366HLD2_9BACT|nr:Verru_Chthon cassette protein C [Roseimicrobium gellanilyticum]RBP43674.1 uncharacterized protein (TIGR02599 family) [Roseimicrobium gellanilyticum]
MRAQPFHRAKASGFTLLEIMISTVIVSVIMLVCVTALDQTQRTWKYSQAKVEQFREARLAFEAITRHISQATLNTYWDYHYAETGTNEAPPDAAVQPSAYVRFSELQFRTDQTINLLGATTTPADHPGHAVFFQAPLGLSQQHRELGTLLNARGYFIEFGSDVKDRPPFLGQRGIAEKFRYRLIEYRPPSERATSAPASTEQGNTVYVKPDEWFRQDLATSSEPLADNIILLLVSPRVSEATAKAANRNVSWVAPSYRYNSLDTDNSTTTVEPVQLNEDGSAKQGTQHLLPPLVQVTLVALDEPSAQRLAEQHRDKPVDLLAEAKSTFTEAAFYERDLGRLKDHLSAQRLNYRVFTAAVAMRNARWDGRE